MSSFQASTFQMAVLLQFNEQLSFSVQQIQSNTGNVHTSVGKKNATYERSLFFRHKPRPIDPNNSNSTESENIDKS